MLPDPSFDYLLLLHSLTHPSFICFCDDVSAFVMTKHLTESQAAVNPTNSLPLRDYIHHYSWSAKVIGIKNLERLKFFLFLNIMATLSWLESPQNSCVPRTSECELICKCGLCRCNKLKWGHTGLRWTLIQWLVSYKKKKHTSKENTM